MKITIVGAGAVGTHLAKLLSQEKMEISLLDESAEHLEGLDNDYDILTRVGSPTSLADLREIGVARSDLFIAVTTSEEANMTACLIAKQMGAKKTLARIDNYEYLLPDNQQFFANMGLNDLIYPEALAATEIAEAIKTNWMRRHLSLCDDKLQLCILKIHRECDMTGKLFNSGFFQHGFYRIVAIKRENQTFIPNGEDEVKVGDLLFIMYTKENMHYIREHTANEEHEVKSLIFYGGGKLTQKAVQTLPKNLNIKILEQNRDICYQLSEKLPNSLIINADGSDMQVLKEEGIQDADAFIALTDRSEANIFACLAAKRFGVRKTIADVENVDYIQIAEGLDVGTVLNKKTITASYIYQMLLDASVLNVHNLASAGAQIVVFKATDHSKIIRGKIKDMGLPYNCTIGGLVRAGEGVLVNGDTEIVRDDEVVVFCKSEIIRQLEKFFQ